MSDAFNPKGSSPTVKPKKGDDDQYDTSASGSTPVPGLRLGETSDALSLHTTGLPPHRPGGLYDEFPAELEADDLPPLYTDDPDAAAPAPLLPPGGGGGSSSLLGRHAGYLLSPSHRDKSTGHECYMDRRLDTDPAFLQKHIEMCALTPPRPFVQVRGTHTETVRKGDKTEKREHVDFDVRVELTPFLYSDINTRASWRELRTADNFEKVRRGTVFAVRAPGFGGRSSSSSSSSTTRPGVDPATTTTTPASEEAGPPGLAEWCHRYCASHAGLKTFLLRRTVAGFDEEAVAAKLEALVRNTGYRGRTTVRFPVEDAAVEVFNQCRTNRWRLLAWLRWLTYLTLLFVFTWPWLFFRTKRFEVAVAEWHFSRFVFVPAGNGSGRREFVSVSEEQWYNMWARAIWKAVLGRRQGTLDQQDLIAAQAAQGLSFDEAAAGGGMAGTVGGFHFGWGGDN
ncbi:hypothetical protein SODALDRAFT_350252 [Sodiomyces alkalinus F11]|uniref:Uncharacterized protein n=1 Tax=Sodiomyces alkalinus (strain CBS 110278 / VKM F-3762 / F11) TaxID=1314773 RepID=A0A3N2PX44_SODAK|nr:hypothetical protein SODALDRAFT_350252 [Sodiomyces alkalinus F11]ROT38986.1 hypothetical protein SODALDRAFT_350252 [Sodiomyces alkalinus F11]